MFTREYLYILLFFGALALLVFGASALIGWIVRWACRMQHNYGLWVGAVLAALTMGVALYGSTWGFAQLRVRHVSLEFEDLPEAFEGYRIVHITDMHLASFRGHEEYVGRAIDSVLAQKPDMIVFTGDIQNHEPSEIEPHMADLARLDARDGVFSVLGNHDYGYPRTVSSPRGVRRAEEQAGWRVLVNEHAVIERDGSRIVVAGMDNDGDGRRFPQRGDVRRTLRGTADDDFVVMLEHDPTSWRRNILPHSTAQLTLSGHTHAMQFRVLGWSPAQWFYDEWLGLYSEGGRHLYVSGGVGGVLPFRCGIPCEIVVIEMHRKSHEDSPRI